MAAAWRDGRNVRKLLRAAVRSVRAAGWRLAGFVLASQLLLLFAVSPAMGWLFKEALRAGGMHGLDLGWTAGLPTGGGLTITITLLVILVALAFWLIAMQFTAFVVLVSRPAAPPRELLRAFRTTFRRLLRPGAIPLLLYLFLLIPLSGFGFVSVLTQGIAIPSFISGELLKSPSTAVGFGVFLALLTVLNVRLALTVPAFVLTDSRRPVRASLRLTRGLRWFRPALAVVVVVAAGSFAGTLLTVVALGPTWFADVAAPTASPVVAAFSLGFAQVAGMLLVGYTTALVAAVLAATVVDRAAELPGGARLLTATATDADAGGPHESDAEPGPGPVAASDPAAATAPAESHRSRFRPAAAVVGAATAAALAIGGASIGTLQSLSDAPQTLVLSHRGFSDGGVENTIGGLEAASAAGADLVEMDVMQTKDGKFVVMHDTSLRRLAGRPDAVKDLTLAELTEITVRDQACHEGLIPSLEEYVLRAKELNMPLLIEIKLSGAETPDHVARLVDELEELEALEGNIYHSLDAASVAALKLNRPDLTVGYTMAFAGAEAPKTPADFVVVEEWSATSGLQRSAEAAGLGFMAWTVNDNAGMRELLRRNIDGIITDHPDVALAAREQMQDETGLVEILLDALDRFVTVV